MTTTLVKSPIEASYSFPPKTAPGADDSHAAKRDRIRQILSDRRKASGESSSPDPRPAAPSPSVPQATEPPPALAALMPKSHVPAVPPEVIPPKVAASPVPPAELKPTEVIRLATPEETAAVTYAKANPYFAHVRQPAVEIVEGLFQERQIGYLAGDWSLGKTPLLQQWGLSVVAGIPFLGYKDSKRPVIVFDAESADEDYVASLERIARRLGVPPRDIVNLHPVLRFGAEGDKMSAEFQRCIGNPALMCTLFENCLKKLPNALIIVDPLPTIVPFKENYSQAAIAVYNRLRGLLAVFRHAAFLFSLHLRKSGASEDRFGQPESRSCWRVLVNNARLWFQEVNGSNKIGAHGDLRLGMAAIDEQQFVVSGFRRGKDMLAPVFFEKTLDAAEPYDADGNPRYAGFTLIPPPPDAFQKLKPEQLAQLQRLALAMPSGFRFNEVADKTIPRVTLHRLLQAAIKAGLVCKDAGKWCVVLDGGQRR
jgi:hypothetical protein